MKNVTITALLIFTFLFSTILGMAIQQAHFPTERDLALEASMEEPVDCKPLRFQTSTHKQVNNRRTS